MRVVAFSVHTDDVVFSVGAYLAALGAEVTIVSPFAGIPNDEIGFAKHITLNNEHNAACAVIGATPVNGVFLDDVYPAPKRTDVREWLKGWFVEAKAVPGPFGIAHPDHLLTSNLLLDLIRTEPVIPSKIYFYEELPYRVNFPEQSHTRFTHIENAIGRLKLIEEQYTNDTKERSIRAYASQIERRDGSGVDEDLISKLLVRERIWELIR